MECQICVEPFTKQKRKEIKCEYCDFSCCKNCFERYLLNETGARCMSKDCGRDWSPQFISENFTNVFISGPLKSHVEDVLFDKERALLPATQPIVENMILAEEIQEKINDEYLKIRRLERNISSMRIQRNRLLNRTENQKERSKFVKACPDENCRGFLSSQWKCGICQKWTCPDCHEIKGLDRDCVHVCDENAKATATLLNNDTKSCPNCGVGIHKIDGCDQMWCTECHTAFSWRSGRVENNVHNPHYYEWMRRTGGEIPRNHNEVQCGREIDHHLVRNMELLLASNIYLSDLRKFIRPFCREIIHIRFVVMDRFVTDHVRDNQELRIKYLRNQIDENEFKRILQINNKRDNKKREIYNIYVLYVNTCTDILYRFHNIINYPHYLQTITCIQDTIPLKTILQEIIQIYDYVDECCTQVAKTYKITKHNIYLGNVDKEVITI